MPDELTVLWKLDEAVQQSVDEQARFLTRAGQKGKGRHG
jgi:hypothetical protein